MSMVMNAVQAYAVVKPQTHTHTYTHTLFKPLTKTDTYNMKMKSGLETKYKNVNEWKCVFVLNEREWGQVWWKAIYAWKIQIEFFHSIWMRMGGSGYACIHLMWIRMHIRMWIVDLHNTSKLWLIQLWRLSYWCIKLFFSSTLYGWSHCCYYCYGFCCCKKTQVDKRIIERNTNIFLYNVNFVFSLFFFTGQPFNSN